MLFLKVKKDQNAVYKIWNVFLYETTALLCYKLVINIFTRVSTL